MTKKLREALKASSEAREALNKLAADAPDEAQTAAQTAYETAEAEVRTALDAEPESRTDPLLVDPNGNTAEERERLELRGRCLVTEYVRAAARGVGVAPGSAEAEYAAAEGCVGQLPLSLLFGPPPVEERAAATVAAGAVAENVMPVSSEVFVSPLAARLGIMTPTVAAGTASFPYIGTGASPAAVAKGVAVGDSSPAIQAKTVSPGAVASTFQFQREDAALLADLESALSMNIREGLADEFDAQVVAGDNTGANLDGLLTQHPATAPADNTVTTFAELAKATAPFLDGKFAETFGQIRLITSPTVAHFLKSLLIGGSVNADDAFSWLMRTFSGGISVSSRAPVIAAVNHTQAATRRAGGGGLWAVRTRVPILSYAPIWSGADLVRDEISGAKARSVSITAFLIAGGVAIVRGGAYTVATIKTVAGTA